MNAGDVIKSSTDPMQLHFTRHVNLNGENQPDLVTLRYLDCRILQIRAANMNKDYGKS